MVTPRSPEREQRSEKSELEMLPGPNTGAEHPLLSAEMTCWACVCPTAIKRRAAVNLTKTQSHQRREGSAPVDGWELESGPNRRKRGHGRLNPRRVGKVWTCIQRNEGVWKGDIWTWEANVNLGWKPFFPASVRKATTDLMTLFSGR